MNLIKPPRDATLYELQQWCEDLWEFIQYQALHLIKFVPRSDAPASPDEGTFYYDSDVDTFLYWDGSEWRSFGNPPGDIADTTRIINTDSPYTVLATDVVIFCDTDGGAIETDLPAGIEGTHYKLINCGSSGNDLTVDPDGTEELYGAGAGVASTLADGEVIDIHYNATEGWF